MRCGLLHAPGRCPSTRRTARSRRDRDGTGSTWRSDATSTIASFTPSHKPRRTRAGVERIVGVDLSAQKIDFALQNFEQLAARYVEVEFHCADFLQFATDERFDLVFAMGMFDHLVAPERALKRMKELARHSVVVSFPRFSVYRTPIGKVRGAIRRRDVYTYSPSSIEHLARARGFWRLETTKVRGSGTHYFVAPYV